MKNISFMQLVLGTSGAMLIWAGVKNIDIMKFFKELVERPRDAFSGVYNLDKFGHVTGASHDTTPSPGSTPAPNTNVMPV
jgi:hypothetical protein